MKQGHHQTHDSIPAIATVKTKRWEIEGVAIIDVKLSTNQRAWAQSKPGQFAMLYGFGVGEIPISFSTLPSAEGRVSFTIRRTGAVSAALTRIKCGGVIGMRGPFGNGWPIEQLAGRDVVIIAGGLGVAPLRPVIDYLAFGRSDANRATLFYGAREPAAILYTKDIERWRNAGVDVHTTVDTASHDWRGNVGVVTSLLSGVPLDSENTVALICGPEIMMRYAAEALKDAGVSDEDVWLSLERNMKCAIGFCGHCQFGPAFICKDGPAFAYDQIRSNLFVREL